MPGTGSASRIAVITPSDDTLPNGPTKGVSFGTAGILKVTPVGSDTPVEIPSGALSAGIIHPLEVTKIHEYSGGAADIVAYW